MHMNELCQHIQPSGTEWAFTWIHAAPRTGGAGKRRVLVDPPDRHSPRPFMALRPDAGALANSGCGAGGVDACCLDRGCGCARPGGLSCGLIAAMGEIAIYSSLCAAF